MPKWRVVAQHPNYAVSNDGRVMRVAPGHGATVGKILKPRVDKRGGYLTVNLRSPGGRRMRPIHQLVAAAFIGPCPDGHEVNHKNTPKTNNCASNLEYVTPSGNTQHAWDTGLQTQTAQRSVRQAAAARGRSMGEDARAKISAQRRAL